ncbi:MAG: carbohydrate-binding domain-containing protein [Clostridia bacterium]|nr:carbohydrate-binding domain-containing protein [Clostridia bacterium]
MKKITALLLSLLMAFTVAVAAAAEDAYTATFTITGADGSITVYDTQDYTAGYTSLTAAARDSDTGEADVSGSGQINFTVVPADGYAVESVTVTGSYKNLKGPSDTGVDNTYRITKVASDLTVTVVLAEAEESEEETGDPVITFTDEAATVAGSETGVSVSGTNVKITAAGTYTFTGSCANGAIVVKKNVTGVTLILDGLTLTASATAPITCNKGSGVTIVAAAGSVNNLTDDRYNNDDVYTDETVYPDIENAVIKCKDGSNVTICGTGTINVNAYGKNGVKGGADLYEEDADGNYTDVLLSTASLTIEDVTLNVSIKHSYKDPDDPTSYDGDGIKSEKELNILSGNITVSANDDGVKCDYTLNIGAEGATGPTIKITKSTEGIEGAVINVYSGSVYVTASDDGVNAANGDIAERSADFSYNQYGGYVYVNVTNGDGIDSNGSVNLAGGTLEVYAPAQGDGDPIDTEYGCAFGGATVLAVGHNAMMQNFSGAYVAFGGSGMGSFGGMGGFGGSSSNLVTAGSAITVKDAGGNTLYTGKAVRNASYVVFASPTLTSGSSCTLYNGSSSVSTATAATSSGGTQPGGTQPGGNQPGGNQPGSSSSLDFSGIFQRIIQWFKNLINMIKSVFGG